MSLSDTELIQQYAQHGSQPAFATLVSRHLNLVYSAARRQVRSPQLAEEVAQSVFCDLARNAGTFKPGASLTGWLYLVTRRTAIDAIRKESRRQSREQAVGEVSAMNAKPDSWTRIEPLLDEAMETLPEADRSVLLLRFFEDKSLREVGETLGTSENAAQKRVARAIDQLRAAFLRRGVAITAAGLATDLSAHALETAPISLKAAIAATTVSLPPAATAAGQLVMTTAQKSLIGVVTALVVGAGLFETGVFARQQSDLDARQSRATELAAQLKQTRDRQKATAARLKSVEIQIDTHLAFASGRLSSGDAALEAQMHRWLADVDSLKRQFDAQPNRRIPELALLTDSDWLGWAEFAYRTKAEHNVQTSLWALQQQAEKKMALKIREALIAYLRSNGDWLPNRVEQLVPYFTPPIDPAWLARYEMRLTGKASATRIDIIGLKAPVDVESDKIWTIGIEGISEERAFVINIDEAQSAFARAQGNSQVGPTAAQLMPYLKWPTSEAAVRRYLETGRTPAQSTP